MKTPQTGTTMARRDFLLGCSALAAASTLAPLRPTAAPTFEGVIDTHTHFYDPTRPEGVPWPDKDDRLLYRPVLPTEYRDLTRDHGVTATVVVEASAWIRDNDWVLALADKEPMLAGLVGRLDPAQADFRKDLDRLRRNPRFRGIRIAGATLASRDAALTRNLAYLADQDLSLDVVGDPGLLAAVAALAKDLPDLRVIIDHVAGVRVDGNPPAEAWVRGIQSAAESARVYCKVSGLVEGTGQTDGSAPKDWRFYRKVLDCLWESLGSDRLIYGSNWPVSARFAGYATVQAIVEGYFGGKGQDALAKVLRRNALAAYKPVLSR